MAALPIIITSSLSPRPCRWGTYSLTIHLLMPTACKTGAADGSIMMPISPCLPQPLTTPMGRSLTVFLLMPAAWQVSTTAVTSL